jgi:hypothetical protein
MAIAAGNLPTAHNSFIKFRELDRWNHKTYPNPN